MQRNIKAALITLGIVSIVYAVLGLFYNVSGLWASFSGAFEKLIKEQKLLYFYQSFYVMSAICIVFYLVLLFCGVYFLRLQIRFMHLFIAILVCEMVYFFSLVFISWNLKGVFHSIAAATGVANGGLMVQFLILFPLWGIFLAVWTKKKIQNTI